MAYVHNRLSEIHQNKLCFLTLRSNRGQNRPLKGPFLLKINLPGYPPVKKTATLPRGRGGASKQPAPYSLCRPALWRQGWFLGVGPPRCPPIKPVCCGSGALYKEARGNNGCPGPLYMILCMLMCGTDTLCTPSSAE